jgi:hypothetical protein
MILFVELLRSIMCSTVFHIYTGLVPKSGKDWKLKFVRKFHSQPCYFVSLNTFDSIKYRYHFSSLHTYHEFIHE